MHGTLPSNISSKKLRDSKTSLSIPILFYNLVYVNKYCVEEILIRKYLSICQVNLFIYHSCYNSCFSLYKKIMLIKAAISVLKVSLRHHTHPVLRQKHPSLYQNRLANHLLYCRLTNRLSYHSHKHIPVRHTLYPKSP